MPQISEKLGEESATQQPQATKKSWKTYAITIFFAILAALQFILSFLFAIRILDDSMNKTFGIILAILFILWTVYVVGKGVMKCCFQEDKPISIYQEHIFKV